MSIESFYRFRKVENLFGTNRELERQSIYFASPEQLNDPIEGFRDIYWEGDEVVWENLFQNYLLCLTSASINYLIFGEDESIEEIIYPSLTVDDLPEEYRGEFQAISDVFFCHKQVRKLISNIAKHRTNVGELELALYLKITHILALSCISERLISSGFSSHTIVERQDLQVLTNINESWFKNLNEIKKDRGEKALQIHFEIQAQISSQNILMVDYNNEEKKPNKKLLVTKFYLIYIKKLEKLMYPDWYTACFMTECSNSSVWGNYGDNHRGVCLIFSPKKEQERLSLPLSDAITGWGGKGAIKGTVNFSFYPISYNDKLEPVNFFESIGQIPLGKVFSNWFIGKDERHSTLMPYYSDEWRGSHWEAFYEAITQKTKDWKYENEYRLIINNMMGSYGNNDRTLKYEFSSIKGIIFGIKTSEEDKHRVIKVIEKKVREHKHYNFKFYQAYYFRESGEIKHYELRLLSFQNLE